MKESFRLLRPFLRGLPLILLSIVLAVLVAKKYLSYVTPMYESTAKIKLADLTQGVPNNNLFKDLDVFASSNKIAAEIELIKSSVLLEQCINKVGFDNELHRIGGIRKQELYTDAPILVFPIQLDAYLDQTFTITVNTDSSYSLATDEKESLANCQFGDTIRLQTGRILIAKNNQLLEAKPNTDLIATYEYKKWGKEKCIEQVRHNLDVISADKDVPVISIIYKSAVPQKAADFANQLAQTYIHDYVESKFQAAETTVQFLDDRINEVSSSVSKSENQIESYKDQNGIINLSQQSETDLRKIAQLKIELSNLKIGVDALQELEDNMRSNKTDFLLKAPNFQAYTDLLSTELIKKIKNLQSERRDLLLTFTPKDTRVQVIDDKLDDLIVYLVEGVTNSKRNQKTKYEQLRNEIQIAETVFDGFATKQKDMTVMNRDFTIYETSYNFLNEKRIEAEIAKAAKISFHRIISPAAAAKKAVAPNKSIITIVSGLLALIGSIGLIYLIHAAKGKVNDITTIEAQSAIPIAIKTPFLETATATQRHFLREAIQLELKGLTDKGALLCLTSNTNNEGRQFHAQQLASAFATQGRKVLVLDFQGILKIETCAVENMSDIRFRQMSKTDLAAEIAKRAAGFDLVLMDNEDLENERLGLLLMSIATTNLYVVDSRRTPANHIQEVDLLVDEFKLPNSYFILNKDLYNPSVIREIATFLINVKNQAFALIQKRNA